MKTITKLVITAGFACLLVVLFQALSPLIANAAICNTNSDCGNNHFDGNQFCQSNSLYQYYVTYSCNNPGTAIASCTDSKIIQLLKTCDSNQRCENTYWHTGCTETINTNTASPGCISHSYQKCVGTMVYWYDSCGNQQDLYQMCSYNQICSNNSCINQQQQQTICMPQATKKCVGNIAYWYDSCGNIGSVYQNCGAANQMCQGGSCANYQPVYINHYENSSQAQINQTQNKSGNLVISIFSKKEGEAMQWGKSINAANGDKINFLLVVKNISTDSVNNVSVKAEATNNITDQGDLKIDNLSFGGNISSGINLGTISSNTSKVITFTAAAQAQNSPVAAQVLAKVSSDATTDSDFLTMNIDSNQSSSNTIAAISGDSSISGFIKKWYVWIIIIIVLIVLFVIIFRRLSNNV